MDRFSDGLHVWLRSPVRADYLFADDDGSEVSLSRHRTTVNAAWRVQRVVLHDGTPCFLLQSAAYGRYLALSQYLAPHGHRGRLAMLRDLDEPRQRNARWRAIAAGDGGDDVLLCTLEGKERYLRAHGNLSRTCSCATIDTTRSTMAHWTVEQIPPRPAPPALPTPSTDKGGRSEWYRRIRCTLANDEGDFIGEDTFRLNFSGRSIFKLRRLVAKEAEKDIMQITLCVKAGSNGRLTPLVIDLPRCREPLDIVVLPTSSAGAKALVHPDTSSLQMLKDGAFVHMTCMLRGQCCYLHAQGDNHGVNLSPGPTSLQDVWGLHKMQIDSEEFLLLRSATYGRYFALESETTKQRSRFVLVDYEDKKQSNLLWVATSFKGGNEVHLSNKNDSKELGIAWSVEIVPISSEPHLLPAQVEAKGRKIDTDLGQPLERIIWYRREDSMGLNPWTTILFKGKSLSALRSEILNDRSLILCTRAGSCGQLTPLMTDLPDNNETMKIIILTHGSPAARELRYPMVNPRVV